MSPLRFNEEHGRTAARSASLLAVIAVAGPAARYAEAQGATAPEVQTISFANSPVRGDTYELGEKIEVLVRFNPTVEAYEGRKEVALTVGDHTRHAQFQAITPEGRGLKFFYTVRADDHDADGISIPVNALSFDHGTLRNDAGKTVTVITHEAVAADAGRKVDGSRVTALRSSLISYYVPSRGRTYRRDQRIEVRVEFDRAVRVTGAPQMALTIGTETRRANFLPNHPAEFIDPESSIHFCYTVRQEDEDTDGISIPANALSLNGGAISYGRVNGRLSAA